MPGFVSSASTIGRPMASPAIMMALIPSRWTVSQTSSASNLGERAIVLPWKTWPMTPHCAAPCMRGGVISSFTGVGLAAPFLASSSSVVTLWPVVAWMPWPRAMKPGCWSSTPH